MNATFALAAAHLAPGASGVQLADLDPNKVTPGLLGFVVFAAIGGALWLLLKSMNKQFQKVNFEEEPEAAGSRAARVAPRLPQPAKEPAAEAADGSEVSGQPPAKGSDSGA